MYSSWCAGLLTSLRLVVRCLPPVTTERGREEGERRKKEERRGKGRREKEVGYTGSTQPSRLSSSWWRHYRLLAICDLERHPISSHSLPPHEPPSQAGCPGRVLYRHIEISVRAHRERQLPSGCLLQLAICCHMPRCFPAITETLILISVKISSHSIHKNSIAVA
jgi:hypothetical protein